MQAQLFTYEYSIEFGRSFWQAITRCFTLLERKYQVLYTSTASEYLYVAQGRMHDDSCALILLIKDKIARKTLRTACANLRGVTNAGLHAYFQEYLAETQRLLADNDQRGFYKHLKGTVGLGGPKVRSKKFNMDDDGTLLRDEVRIRERWGGVLPDPPEQEVAQT